MRVCVMILQKGQRSADVKKVAAKKYIWLFGGVLLVGIFAATYCILVACRERMPYKPYYTAADFELETMEASVDFDKDGVDDYTDILLGARADAIAHPTYDGTYYEGGYPPNNIGVCTDVIWRAFRDAGYCLRDMVDKDIQNRPEVYPHIEHRDNNIDFRRVPNLHIFFGSYAIPLTTDINDIAAWQPGDIVIFEDNKHIGIVSDRRNRKGQPFIIHNADQKEREEDCWDTRIPVAHYRFDASKIDPEVLVKWEDREKS